MLNKKACVFTMLAKSARAMLATGFRPIASIRLFYTTFVSVYTLVHRMRGTLAAAQPEEQHCFRPQRQMEEHLLSANVLSDKTSIDENTNMDSDFGFVPKDKILASIAACIAQTKHFG